MSDEERTPPERVRITKLQEAQLHQLERIDQQCVQMYYDIGFDPQELKPRTEMEIGGLARSNDVLVAEADDEPAGYLVWADEAPGVAHIQWLAVAPAYQRFGIATRLLRAVGESAAKHGIEVASFSLVGMAPWAMAFMAVRGFSPLGGGEVPKQITSWQQQQAQALAETGRTAWWAKCDGLGTIPGLPRPR